MQERPTLTPNSANQVEADSISPDGEFMHPEELALFLTDISTIAERESSPVLEGILQLAFHSLCQLALDDPVLALEQISALLNTDSVDLQVRVTTPILFLASRDRGLGQAVWREFINKCPDAVVDSCVLVEEMLADVAEGRASQLPTGRGGLEAAKFYWDEMRPRI